MATETAAPAAVTHTVTMPTMPETAAQLAAKLQPILKELDCDDRRYDFHLRLAAALIKEGIVG